MDIQYTALLKLDSGFKTLPQVFKSKFEEKMTIVGTYLESPEEFIQSDGKFLLNVPNFTMMEKYKDHFVGNLINIGVNKRDTEGPFRRKFQNSILRVP